MLRHIKIGHKYELTEIKFKREIPEHLLSLKPDTYFLGKDNNRFMLSKHENGEFAGMFQIHIGHFAFCFQHDGTFMIMMKYDHDAVATLCNVDFKEHNDMMEMIMQELHDADRKSLEDENQKSRDYVKHLNRDYYVTVRNKKQYQLKINETEGVSK